MTGLAKGSTSSGRFDILDRLVILACAVGGVLLGRVVHLVWPNDVYGYQLLAGGAAIVQMVVGLVLWRRRRLPASVLVAGGAGLLLGIAAGYPVRPESSASNEVSLDVTLRTPAVATLHTTSGTCLILDDRLMLLESADGVALVDGRSISVTLSQGTYRQAPDAPADELSVDVRIASALEDGSSTETWMGSDATSTVIFTGTARDGTVDFSGLVLRSNSELRDPIDVSGSISWTCEPPS